MNFKNEVLKEAVTSLRAAAGQDKETINKAMLKTVAALVNTKILIPAKWDKEPVVGENGEVVFPENTKISFMVVSSGNGKNTQKFFPAFTSIDEAKNFYGGSQEATQSLVVAADRYMKMLEDANGEIKGLVINPGTDNIPVSTGMLKTYIERAGEMKQNRISSGDRFLLRNPKGNVQDMEAALISAGFHEPAVNAIYLKERMENPENPEAVHWLVLIDSNELDVEIFRRISKIVGAAAKGKEMEFMFTNSALGKDIASTSAPLYTRMFN